MDENSFNNVAQLTENEIQLDNIAQLTDHVDSDDYNTLIENFLYTPTLDYFSDNIDENIEYTNEQIQLLFNEIVRKWIHLPLYTQSDMYVQYKLFDLEYSTTKIVTFDELKEKLELLTRKFFYILALLRKLDVYEKNKTVIDTKLQRAWNIIRSVHEKIKHDILIRMNSGENHVPSAINSASIVLQSKCMGAISESFASNEDVSEFDFKPQTKVLLWLLNDIKENGFRRKGKFIYEEKFTEPNAQGRSYCTRNFVEKCSIAEYIFGAVSKELHFEMWNNLYTNCNPNKIIDILENAKESEFPDLEVNRYASSFRNGIYIANEARFIPYAEMDKCKLDQDFTEMEKYKIDPNLVTCKYHDIDMPIEAMNYQLDEDIINQTLDREDEYIKTVDDIRHLYYNEAGEYVNNEDIDTWRELKDPHFTAYLQTQKFPDPIIYELIYFIIGRLIYEINDRENFQILPFVQGVAGSGKSLLAKICQAIYEDKDVGKQSPNLEEQWGIGQFAKSLFFICTEVRRNMNMNIGEFLQITAGDPVSLARKHKDPESLTWKIHGIWMGNEIVNWIDTAGNLARRFFIFRFLHVPETVNPQLLDLIMEEFGTILVKANCCYLEYSARFGNQGIWEWVPSYFHDTQRYMLSHSHPLESFLQYSDDIEVTGNEDDYMKRDLFFVKCQIYIRRNCTTFQSVEINDDSLETVFKRRGITMFTGLKEDQDGTERNSKWLLGIKLANSGSSSQQQSSI